MPFHYVFFACLYFLQGAAFAYVVNFQKPYLATHGIAKETIGLFTALLLIPFIAKVFLGMLSDRLPLGRGGRRKPYMLIGLALFALCYFSLRFVPVSGKFFEFALITWLASLGLALFDTAADGWAIDAVRQNQQGGVQGAMVAGRSLGLISMSAVFGTLSQKYGVESIFSVLSMLALLVWILVILTPYRPQKAAVGVVQGSSPSGGWRAYLFFALFGILYSISSFGVDGLLTLHLVEVRGGEQQDIGFFGVWRGIGALIGAGVFAFASLRQPLERLMPITLILLGVGCLLPMLPWSFGVTALLWGLCWGLQETAFVTLAMRLAPPAWAATFFAISMIFSNVGTSIGEAVATGMVPKIGYNNVFLAAAVLAWFSLWPLHGVLKKKSKGTRSRN